MLTALTVYFWLAVVVTAVLYVINMFTQPKIKPDSAKDQVERFVYTGCGTVLISPLLIGLTAPLAYLQSVGLQDWGLPGWWVWAFYGLSLLMGVVSASVKRYSATGAISALPWASYVIAWHGLQVLTAAA